MKWNKKKSPVIAARKRLPDFEPIKTMQRYEKIEKVKRGVDFRSLMCRQTKNCPGFRPSPFSGLFLLKTDDARKSPKFNK